MKALVGIDVGTGSARAGVFGLDGHMLASARRPITIWHEAGEIVEQSSDQIWQAVCEAVREAVAASGLKPEAIAGIGFDATCSLVAVDATGGGVPVGPSEAPRRNVIVWMDHRANAEAEEINRGAYPVLDYVGGRISPEMETPKLLWLSRHRPDSFARAAHFFDLSDYLTWRATGSLDRSLLATGFPYDNATNPLDNFAEFAALTRRSRGVRRCGAAALDLCLTADGTWYQCLYAHRGTDLRALLRGGATLRHDFIEVAAAAKLSDHAGPRVSIDAATCNSRSPTTMRSPILIPSNGSTRSSTQTSPPAGPCPSSRTTLPSPSATAILPSSG